MKEHVLSEDFSFGIIPLQLINGTWQVFIIQSITGHWGFPKGHVDERDANPYQTAQRELREETGFTLVSYFLTEPLVFSYQCRSHGKYVHKTVTLFIGQVTGNIHPCPIEVLDSMWVDLDTVEHTVVFEPIQPVLKKLKEIVAEL